MNLTCCVLVVATFRMWRKHLKATGWPISQAQLSGVFVFSLTKCFTLANMNCFAFHKYSDTKLITEKFDLYS